MNVKISCGIGAVDAVRAQKCAQALLMAGKWNGSDQITIINPGVVHDLMAFDGTDALIEGRHYRIEKSARERLADAIVAGGYYRFQDLPDWWVAWDVPARFAGRVVEIGDDAVRIKVRDTIIAIPTRELAEAFDAGDISIIDLAKERLTKPARVVVEAGGPTIRVQRGERDKAYARRKLTSASLQRLLALMRMRDWQRNYESDEDFVSVTIVLHFAGVGV